MTEVQLKARIRALEKELADETRRADVAERNLASVMSGAVVMVIPKALALQPGKQARLRLTVEDAPVEPAEAEG